MTTAEKKTLDGTAAGSPFVDLAGTPFATAMDQLYNLTRNPNARSIRAIMAWILRIASALSKKSK